MSHLSRSLFITILCFPILLNLATPRVSIITSVFKGDKFIEPFLNDITQQTIFDQCELVIINANSPGNEETVIERYMEIFPNIVYIKLGYDPGIYGVWNMGIKFARSEYITNANLDDRFRYDCYEIHANYLDQHENVDLVYSGAHLSFIANERFYDQKALGKPACGTLEQFEPHKMLYEGICYPSNHPMWHKRMHRIHGLFDESFKSSGDLEMWIRAACVGNSKFVGISDSLGLIYINPEGISTKQDSLCYVENKLIRAMYVDKTYNQSRVIEYL